jgi:hypothetical protein
MTSGRGVATAAQTAGHPPKWPVQRVPQTLHVQQSLWASIG